MTRILLIDDNSDLAAMLRLVLEKRMGHEVITASSGPEGLDKAFAERPDIALVDVMMPGMTGYDVVKQLRSDERTRAMSIIMVTARGQSVDRTAALAAGADEHLAKPVNLDDLERCIQEVQNRAQAAAAPQHPLTLAVLSLKGGTGVTTIASNLACLLQASANTILIDLSPSSGHSAASLGLSPSKHWGSYLQDPGIAVESLLIAHSTGLRLLASPPLPYEFGWFDADRMDLLFVELEGLSGYVVVDMPPILDPVARAVLAKSDFIILVTGDDPYALQTTVTTQQVLPHLKERIAIVRSVTASGPHPTGESLERILRQPLAADLPFEPQQAALMRKGTPLALGLPESSVVKELRKMLKDLIPG